jgi:hypothetical protein
LPQPQPIEDLALRDAAKLIKFAAENVKELPEGVLSSIALCWDANTNQTWTPDV